QNMVDRGELKAWKTAGGHRRIPEKEIQAALQLRVRYDDFSANISGDLDILIAEDDKIMQLLYRSTIERWGFPVKLRIVNNGFEGLIEVGRRCPDVLISDLMMPGMDGYEMIRRLREMPELESTDILVISSIDPATIEQQGLPDDVTIFSKPIPFHEIKGFVLARLAARRRDIKTQE
ncbi:MAG: hypothetical protein ACD_10C00530G0001, partial [uncultured bacterium]